MAIFISIAKYSVGVGHNLKSVARTTQDAQAPDCLSMKCLSVHCSKEVSPGASSG
jgi:hypothetical protein